MRGSLRNRTSVQPLPGRGQGIRVLHMVRDLSAWVPQRSARWDPGAQDLLQGFSATLFPPDGSQIVPAHLPDRRERRAADGDLAPPRETPNRSGAATTCSRPCSWRTATSSQESACASSISADTNPRNSWIAPLDAFVSHEAWHACYELNAGPGEFFGPDCPIRQNLELIHAAAGP